MASAGKRILIVVQNLPVPFDRRVWLEATTLQSNGFQVTVICPKLRGFNESRETIEDVEILRYPMPIDPASKFGFMAEFLWAWLATLAMSLRVAVRGRGFDVIHACNPPDTYWLLALLWKPFGKKFVFDHHDLSPEMFKAKFGDRSGMLLKTLLFLERNTFRLADVAIATNASHREIAITRGGMDPERVFVVRSGPDVGRLRVYPPDPAWSNGKRHLIAYLGDISPQDGVDGLVRIVDRLGDIRDDFHVVVIGGGSALDNVRRYAEKAGVAHQFTFTGVVSDQTLCRILSSATVAVDPAPRNDWTDRSTMNKIVEYMFFGLPIVAYDLKETRYSAQEAVQTVASGESEFAATLSRLMDDEAKRTYMSEFGRERLDAALAWQHSVPSLLTAYDVALGRDLSPIGSSS